MTTPNPPGTPPATVTPLDPVARLSLRATEAGVGTLFAAMGLDLPGRIGARSAVGATEALRLGPDEWVLLAPDAEAARLAAACAAADAPHSLVDISDREISVRIAGPGAADLLSIGCPRDIDAIAVGEGRRTVVDGVTAVLWRDGPQEFRLDVWRSFAPHVLALLDRGCAELAAEA